MLFPVVFCFLIVLLFPCRLHLLFLSCFFSKRLLHFLFFFLHLFFSSLTVCSTLISFICVSLTCPSLCVLVRFPLSKPVHRVTQCVNVPVLCLLDLCLCLFWFDLLFWANFDFDIWLPFKWVFIYLINHPDPILLCLVCVCSRIQPCSSLFLVSVLDSCLYFLYLSINVGTGRSDI